VSPVRYELRSYIPEDGIPHSRRRENLEPYSKELFVGDGLIRRSHRLQVCDYKPEFHRWDFKSLTVVHVANK
jgi:hypothetical protein